MANQLPERFRGVRVCKDCGATRKTCKHCRQCQRHCRCDKYEPPLVKELTLNLWSYDVKVEEKAGEKDTYLLVFENRQRGQKVILEDLPDYLLENLAEAILNTGAVERLRDRMTEECLSGMSVAELYSLFQYMPDDQLQRIIKEAKDAVDRQERFIR